MTRIEVTLPLSGNQREVYGRVADVLICGHDGMPSATQVDVHTHWIDEALRLRPDLRPTLDRVIKLVGTEPDVRTQLADISTSEPELFEAVGMLTAGSYYMDDRVRNLMGYPGQEARPLVDDVDQYIEMLERVVDRDPIYRTPPT